MADQNELLIHFELSSSASAKNCVYNTCIGTHMHTCAEAARLLCFEAAGREVGEAVG